MSILRYLNPLYWIAAFKEQRLTEWKADRVWGTNRYKTGPVARFLRCFSPAFWVAAVRTQKSKEAKAKKAKELADLTIAFCNWSPNEHLPVYGENHVWGGYTDGRCHEEKERAKARALTLSRLSLLEANTPKPEPYVYRGPALLPPVLPLNRSMPDGWLDPRSVDIAKLVHPNLFREDKPHDETTP